MYQIRSPGYSKRNQAARWALPDRVFFACGACRILAHAFLERYGSEGVEVIWIKPGRGHVGNHVVVSGAGWIFDYHGYAERDDLLRHTWRRAERNWPGWTASLVPIPPQALLPETASRTIDGLWLRGPEDFLHDPLPRARRYLDRFPPPPDVVTFGPRVNSSTRAAPP